jgi:DNA-binding NarL/FixJ family response regulator
LDSGKKKIRLVVVDDHELSRVGLKALLSREGDMEVVGEAADGNSGIGVVRAMTPDVVLMDIKMPGLDGIEATRRLAEEHPGVRVIAVTHLEHEAYVRRMMQVGASGFVLKSRAMEDLKKAVRSAHAGNRFVSPPLAHALSLDKTTPSVGSTIEAKEVSLTAREQQVLRLVASGRSAKEIAVELGIKERMVEFYEANLNQKVGVPDRGGLLRYAQRLYPGRTNR